VERTTEEAGQRVAQRLARSSIHSRCSNIVVG
jgi:hypothetical protein